MTNTFKKCTIFAISAVWLVLMRMLFSVLNIGDYLSDWLFSFLVQVVGMGVIPFLLYKFWVKDDPWKGFYVEWKLSPKIYIIAVILGFLVSFLLIITSAVWQTVMSLLGYNITSSGGTVYPVQGGVGIFIAELITTALLPGIFEELNYRGLGMRMLSDIQDEKAVIIIIGLLFGFGHQYILQTGYAFVAGVIFAYLAVKTKSIVPGMIIHFMNNAISVIGEFSEQRGGLFSVAQNYLYNIVFSNWIIVIACGAVDVVLVVFLLKLVKKITAVPQAKEEKKDNGFYYPDKIHYVDALFGDLPLVPEKKAEEKRAKWYEYAPLYGAAAIMLIATFFTFVWGMWR